MYKRRSFFFFCTGAMTQSSFENEWQCFLRDGIRVNCACCVGQRALGDRTTQENDWDVVQCALKKQPVLAKAKQQGLSTQLAVVSLDSCKAQLSTDVNANLAWPAKTY